MVSGNQNAINQPGERLLIAYPADMFFVSVSSSLCISLFAPLYIAAKRSTGAVGLLCVQTPSVSESLISKTKEAEAFLDFFYLVDTLGLEPKTSRV